jgi:hypothetical protein
MNGTRQTLMYGDWGVIRSGARRMEVSGVSPRLFIVRMNTTRDSSI